jgi:type I restriction enzyme S subunit
MKGMAYPAINDEKFYSGFIALPPLAEQKRIVAKVDELMVLCDRLEAQQQERETRHAALARASLARFADAPTPGNLQFLFHRSYAIPPSELRKSILTLAVQGKLVPQDPNDEPAARVLERIDAAPKRAMRTRATDEEEGDEPIELEPMFELPPGWEWAPFRRLPLHASVGIDRGRSMQGPDKAVGYFKMNNIRNSGGVDLSDLTRIDATPEEVEAFALADGDFLFNTRNSRELVGKTCVFRAPSADPILYNNNILRVRFIEGFYPEFLDYWFRSPKGSAELEKLKSNTTNVCAIYQGKLSGLPCLIPPLAEQRRIVAKVEQLMALVDALEMQIAASRKKGQKLLEAVVGELTLAS